MYRLNGSLALFAGAALWFLPVGASADEARETTASEEDSSAPSSVDEISLAYSPRVIIRDDELLSPRVYRGGTPVAITLRYARTNERDAHRVRFDFAAATLYSQADFEYYGWPEGELASTEGSPVTYIRVDYAYLRSVALPPGFHLRLGGAVDIDLQPMDYVYGPYAVGNYFGAFTLDARGEFEYEVNEKHSLTTELSIPLFGWVMRSPYSVQDGRTIRDNEDKKPARTFFRYVGEGEMQTWNRYRGLRLGLRYDYYPGETWGLLIGAHMRLLSNTTPRPVLAQEYGVAVGAEARF